MTNLTDLQSLLLATAASRDSGSLLPLPTTIKAPAAGVAKSVASLITKACAEERELTDATPVYRSDGDLRYGLFITAVGKHVIGIVEDDGEQGEAVEPASSGPLESVSYSRRPTVDACQVTQDVTQATHRQAGGGLVRQDAGAGGRRSYSVIWYITSRVAQQGWRL